METIIIETNDNNTAKKIKTMLKEMKVSFKTKSGKHLEEEYNPEFVKKILSRAKNAEKGNTIPYDEKLKNELFGS